MPQQSDNDVSIDDISDNEYSDAVEESDMDPDEKQLDCSEDNNKEGDVDNDEEFNPSDDAGDDYDIRPARKKQKLSVISSSRVKSANMQGKNILPTPRKTPAEKSNNPPQSTPSKPSKAPRKLGVKKSNPSKEASTAKEAKDFHPKASKPWITRPKPHTKKYTDTHKYESGIAGNLPDVSKIDKVFLKIIEKLMPLGLEHTLEMLDNRPLNIATMCSGTEAPVLCFRLTNQGLQELGCEKLLQHIHKFSAEIVDFKQHYISANCGNVPIFRDITEISQNGDGPMIGTTVYGAKVVVPSNIDILIAGFCCVDFSKLNNNQKSVDDRGESGDTLHAILDYCEKCRPKIVILENVLGAPWVDEKPKKAGKGKKASIVAETEVVEEVEKVEKTKKAKVPEASIEERFAVIGYLVCYMELDTKDFYIPHTRNRGYMVAVDMRLFESPEQLKAQLKECNDLVIQQQSAASAPVEEFLLKSDDPILRSAISEKAGNKSGKRVEWQKCQVGHEIYRHDLGLGEKRPITHWTRDGSPRNPDFHFPLTERTNRISDTLDIAHLRSVKRGADDRYFSRNLDLSQNVYRDVDRKKSGIIGCYTPHGIPWNTVRGGKIIGREGLVLQGLPVEQMDLSQLSDQNQHDLAGNAMTTTVIGAVMLAAIITFYEILLPDDNRPKMKEEPISSSMDGENILVQKFSDPTASVEYPVREIFLKAADSSRLCYCEGREDKLNIGFSQCLDCKHTICDRCAQHDSHNLQPVSEVILQDRVHPHDFEKYIKKALPMKISFGASFDLGGYIQSFCDAYEGDMKGNISVAVDLLQMALTSDICYRSARRREVWEIDYHSDKSMVRFAIGSFGCEWLLFVKVPSEMNRDNPIRRFFENTPIAQMTPSDDVAIEGSWRFWVPNVRKFKAHIISNGPVVRSYDSYVGLAGTAEQYVHTQCRIEAENSENVENTVEAAVCGDYVLYQKCGQPFNSVHKKVKTSKGEQDLFFYLEHMGQCGNPKEHGFVFTREHRRLDYGEKRRYLARAAFRQPVVQKDSTEHEEEITIVVDGEWRTFDGFHIAPSAGRSIEYRHLQSSPTLELACDKSLAAFTSRLSVDNITLSAPKGQWVEVTRANEVHFFEEFRWALENAKVLDGHVVENLQRLEQWHNITCDRIECEICAPKSPPLLWAYEKKAKGNRKLKQIAFEEPKAASEFERAMKTRPSGISILFRVSQGIMELKVGINPQSLCHRALATLKPKGLDFHTSWCLVTDDTPVRARSLPFELKTAMDEDMAAQPLGFSEDFTLRPEQRRTLSWMLKQEHGVSFSEREFVEASHPQMGYMVMAQASEERMTKGGILASEVGFGKTIMTIALILSRLKADKKFAKKYTGPLIPTKATLVFVPTQLPKQWKTQVEKITGSPLPGAILVIEKVSDFNDYTVKDIKGAILVIVSASVCQKDSYQLALATLSGMVEPADTASPRANATWHEEVRREISTTISVLKNNPGGFQQHLNGKFEANKEAARATELPIPSKRYTGATYQIHSKKRRRGETSPTPTVDCVAERKKVIFLDLAEPDLLNLVGPVLEIFAWARVVIDEFQHYKAITHPTMINLEANSRWGLSGTAPHHDFAGVKTMARLTGINLGQDDYSHMAKDIKEGAKSDMTPSEKFLTFQGVASGRLIEQRNIQAQKFCDAFVRRDFADIAPISCHEHFYLVDQPIVEAAAYLELEQRILAKEFDPKANHVSKSDKESQITVALVGSDNIRQALLLRASQYSIIHDNTSRQELQRRPTRTAMESFNTVLELRDRQCLVPRSQLARKVEIAVWIHYELGNYTGTEFFEHLVERMQSNGFGDMDVTKELRSIIDASLDNYDHDNLQYYEDEACFREDVSLNDALRMTTNQITKLVHEFVHRTQSHRFHKNLQRFHKRRIYCDGCHRAIGGLEDIVLLSSCGHIFCSPCAQTSVGQCPFDGCQGPCHSNDMVLGTDIVGDKALKFFPFGEKIRRIVELILDFIPADDYVIVFVQSDALRKKVVEALKFCGITYTDLKSEHTSSAQLQNFQNGSGGKVIILSMGDSSASGSNLFIANHMIFVAPYLTSGSNAQREYDAARTQAKGRAIRSGQMKDVHIHNFVMGRTIEVDVYERREKVMIKNVGGQPTLVPAADGEKGDYTSRLREKILDRDIDDA